MKTTPQQALRAVRRAILPLALVTGSLYTTSHAQDLPEPGDGFTWERVGDRGLDVFDLAFGPDSTLWATADDGPFRLDTTDGFPGQWIFLSDYPFVGSLIVLGRGAEGDTLVSGRSVTRRSVDGGLTWTQVHDRGGGGLYEVPAGYPHAGRILTGATGGAAYTSSIAYSDDRGATFTPSVVPSPDGNTASAYDFAALPPGSPYAGRILAAGRWGVNVSDDGGETWRESGLWQAVYYFCEAVDAVKEPSGSAVVGGDVIGLPLARAWSSADGGQTWGPSLGQQLPEGPPNGGWSVRAVLSLGGSSALVVLFLGTVYRTDDAGATWRPVGRAPDIRVNPNVTLRSAVLGPDRRLYVGLQDNSAARGWVWRTAETHDPVPVSSEPGPEPEVEDPARGGEALGLEVRPNPSRGTATVTLVLPHSSEVEASVYDVLGRRVAVLHEGALLAGRHEVALDAAEAALPPGVYVVRAMAGSTVASRTVTLLR